MATGKRSIILPLPVEVIWNYVSVIDNWAPLVPGYISHTAESDRRLFWKFKADLGLMKKKIEMQVDITEWSEPKKVSFTMKGLNEKFDGGGWFLLDVVNEDFTRMTGYLDLTASGMKAGVVNSLLKSSVPEMAEQLSEAIADELVHV